MSRSLLLFGLVLGLAGCSSKPPPGVRIFAAVSTREAVEQIARDFEGQTGTPATCSFAASSTLARQIEQGADADLFLSADERWADYLSDKGLVAERRDLLANRLVVVVPARQAAKPALHKLTDLAGNEIKQLALALDPVPAGHYAREALVKAGIWDQVKERVREAGDVRATLAVVERGEADAGFVYATDAVRSEKVHTALEVPEELHTPIRYPLVLLRRGGSSAARAFYDFLGGETAGAHFRKAGFQVKEANGRRQPAG
ncbi:MAG TPA: molybdate ABC transporter substrate-binding protein [Gemmataceae bacterium]|nr:molybdate ABC transporter substrate-binding protein [Gemmataceae bacterium]